jgi:hypothetical protein
VIRLPRSLGGLIVYLVELRSYQSCSEFLQYDGDKDCHLLVCECLR